MMKGHRMIINAIEEGQDPSQVEFLATDHVETAMIGVIDYFEQIEQQADKAEKMSGDPQPSEHRTHGGTRRFSTR